MPTAVGHRRRLLGRIIKTQNLLHQNFFETRIFACWRIAMLVVQENNCPRSRALRKLARGIPLRFAPCCAGVAASGFFPLVVVFISLQERFTFRIGLPALKVLRLGPNPNSPAQCFKKVFHQRDFVSADTEFIFAKRKPPAKLLLADNNQLTFCAFLARVACWRFSTASTLFLVTDKWGFPYNVPQRMK